MRCGLVGRKLAHSYSPEIHQSFNNGYTYDLIELEPDELDDFFTKGDFHGLNVTIPYKQAVIPYCKALSPAASAIGSVNTMRKLSGGGFFGDNTDIAGFKAMVNLSGISVSGKKVVVLGRGGSSLTVCYVLQEMGAGEIVVVSREDNRHDFLVDLSDTQVLVNTSPLGMYPNTGISPVSLDYFPQLTGVLDLIYNPARTQLMIEAEARGIPVLGGLSMLVEQAGAASEIFTGRAVDTAGVIRTMRLHKENLILIGMPGCGKTTIGKLLADSIGKTFVDADAVLVEDVGMTIPEIFRLEGEEGFRKRETETLAKLGRESDLVIATGGGCVTRKENYAHLHQNGVIIFLERDLELLETQGRPLSQGGSLEAMYEKRLPLYRRFADGVVKNNSDVASVEQEIVLMVEKMLYDI